MGVIATRHLAMRRATAILAALSVAAPPLSTMPSFAAPIPLAQGREMTMTEALSGKPFPLIRKLGELNGDWRRFWLHRASPYGGDDPLTRAVMETLEPAPIVIASPVYYTLGETVRIEGKAYLIAYVWRPRVPSPGELQDSPVGKMAPPEPLTSETTIRLALISVSSIRGLNGIRPFDLKTEMAGGIDPGSDGEIFERARASAINTASLSNLKQIGLAAMMYAQDYDERFPPLRNPAEAKRLLFPYVKNEAVFIHPASKKPYVPNPVASRKQMAAIQRPAELILFYEPDVAPDGTRGATFADGHAKRLNEVEWLNAAKYSQIPVAAPPK
jgi:hypothetical protein